VGRILGVFFLAFESAALVAMPPAYDSEIACRESKAVPTTSFTAVEALKLLRADRNSILAASGSSRAYARRTSSPVVDQPFDAGQIPSNRYFIAPELVGFRSEIPIVLWPGIVDESRLEVRS